MDQPQAAPFPRPSRCRRDTYVVVFLSEFVLITVSLCLMTRDCQHEGRRLSQADCRTSKQTYFLVALAYILSVKYIAYYFSFVVVDSYPTRVTNPDKRSILGLWKQYIATLLLSAGLCFAATILYTIPGWVTFAIYSGSFTNAILTIDFARQARAAHYKVLHLIFPMLEEIRPLLYSRLQDSSEGNVWYLRECMICLEDFEPQVSVVQLPCKHVFHTQCVSGWVQQGKGCPVKCRLGPHLLVLPPAGSVAGDADVAATGQGGASRRQAWAAGPAPDVLGAPPPPGRREEAALQVIDLID